MLEATNEPADDTALGGDDQLTSSPDQVRAAEAAEGSRPELEETSDRHGALEEVTNEPHTSVPVDSDDGGSESEVDDNLSEKSYSNVKKEREYAPGKILEFLRTNFRKRGVNVGDSFPDAQAFLKVAQTIMSDTKEYKCTDREGYRLKALMQKVKKGSMSQPECPPADAVAEADA